MQMQRVRIIDRQRKRRLTVDIYASGLRCEQCGAELLALRYRDDEPRQCIYCDSPLDVCEWRVKWDKQKWEKYFDKVREELGLGWSYQPRLFKDKSGQFYLRFSAQILPIAAIVDQRLLPVEVEFRQ
jgi:hypothetical protein